MPTGPVLLIICAIWAVILLPAAVKVYDRSAPQRTSRRFTHAMGALGRARQMTTPVEVMLVRRARPATSVVLDPAIDLHLDHGVDTFSATTTTDGGVAVPAPTGPLSRSAMLRRRRTLTMLSALCLLVLPVVVLGIAPAVVMALPLMLLTAFLGASGFVVARERGRQSLELAQARTRARLIAEAEAEVAAVAPARREFGGSGSADARVGAGAVASRFGEMHLALAATFADEEDRLGLDEYAHPVEGRRRTATAEGFPEAMTA